MGPELDSLERSTRYWPLAGILIGILQVLAYMFTSILLPHTTAVMLTLAVGLMLTGGLHERGLAHFVDQAANAVDREAARATARFGRIQRIGAAGAIAIVVILLLRYETLANIGAEWLAAALVTAAAFSRGCAVLVTLNLRYLEPPDRAQAEGAAPPPARHVSTVDALIAISIGLTPLLLLTVWLGDAGPAALAIPLGLLAAATMRGMIRRRLGGYSLAGLGAVMQVTEIVFLLGLLIALGVPVDESAFFDPGA
jgi:adenosylcobinamide-GDP ribazoletransferase